MPLPINISDLLSAKAVEWERLEFKAGWNPKDVLHTMCAFANDFHNFGGGYILIGVGERNGQPILPPVGISAQEIDAIQKEVLGLGNNAIQPQFHPLIFPEIVDGRHILVIWAPGGQSRPYKAKRDLGRDCRDWGYFIRKGSNTIRAQIADEQELLGLAANVPFDDRINQRATIDDLDLDLIRTFLKEVGSDLYKTAASMDFRVLCQQMQIVDGPAEALFPRNVGLMFFNEEPGRYFPQTQIDVVHFPEGTAADRFEEKVFKGPLSRMLRSALNFIRDRFLIKHVVKHPDRAEATRFWNFPYAAIEEALVNAVYHRSYEIREPIEVRITRDEITILSYPGPDRSISMSKLRQGKAVSRRYRNRRIGEFLKELDLTEGRATGIPKILAAMESNGSPEPEFETDEDRSYFLIHLPVHPLARPEAEVSTVSKLESELGSELGSLEVRILDTLRAGPLSKSEISKALGQKQISGPLHQSIRELVSRGLLDYTVPEKPTSRLQKYAISARAKQWLQTRNAGT